MENARFFFAAETGKKTHGGGVCVCVCVFHVVGPTLSSRKPAISQGYFLGDTGRLLWEIRS